MKEQPYTALSPYPPVPHPEILSQSHSLQLQLRGLSQCPRLHASVGQGRRFGPCTCLELDAMHGRL